MYVMLERKTIQGFRMVELGEYTDLRVHLFKNEQTKDIRECINDALLLVWNNSRPHCNIGWRKITKKNVKLIEKPFERIKRKFDCEVRIFTINYTTYLAENADDFGDVFNATFYPPQDQLSNHFNLELKIVKELPQ